MGRWLAAVAWLCLALPGWAAELLPLPALAARVTDLTGTLVAGQVAALDESLAAIERDKGAQVVILLLPTTRPETIEDFGIRLAEAWKVGRRGVNDGVIVIVAKDDRKMRIEVGYGLEGAIPDAVAKRIVAEAMAPRFRQGDFAGGLAAAVTALQAAIGAEALPAPTVVPMAPSGAEGGEAPQGQYYVVPLLLVLVLAKPLRSALGLGGALLAAFLAGGLAWAAFADWIAVAIASVLGLAAAFVNNEVASWGSGGGGGWSGGSSSSSSDSGGFSGGGGSFGGGGASGDW
jgi:uncharacterized protein